MGYFLREVSSLEIVCCADIGILCVETGGDVLLITCISALELVCVLLMCSILEGAASLFM